MYRTKNHLVLCSGLIFGLIGGGPRNLLLRVTECVGVAAAMHAPLPADAAEQIGAALADAGDAMLPGQHAGPFQHLQRLGNCTTRATGLLGDALIAGEAPAVPA